MIFFSRKKRDRDWRKHRREFVYLDEVSVTSLVAARDGAISETISDTLSKTNESESKASIGLPLKGGTFGAESRVRSADSSSREVVRRAVIQSTFRDLRTGGSGEIPLVRDGKAAPHRQAWASSTVDELKPKLRTLTKNGLALRVDAIRRGDVLELEVILDADNTYRLVSALSSIIEIVNGREVLFGINQESFEQVLPLVEVIDRLLVGLVPIRGTSTRFRLVPIDGVEYIVDRNILIRDSEIACLSRPLEIVGVTEFKSYWRDLRRVLFTDSAYTAYVRVESSGLRADWNPVKLADVLRSINLDVEQIIKELPDSFAAAVDESGSDHSLPENTTAEFERFGRRLASAAGILGAEDGIHAAATLAAIHNANQPDFDGRRAAYEIVVTAVEAEGAAIDREIVRKFREESSSQMASFGGIGTASGRHDAREGTGTHVGVPTGSPERSKLEVEFVAIYW